MKKELTLRVGSFFLCFVLCAESTGCPGDSASLRPLPTSTASPRGGNLYPSGPAPYTCPGVDKPPDTPDSPQCHGLTEHRSLPIEGSYFRMSSRTPPAVCFAPAPAPWMTMGEG